MADRRFQKKRSQLPRWISQAMRESETSLSTDMAVATAKNFLRTMAQPFKPKDQEGISTWSLKDLERHLQKRMEEEEKLRQESAQESAGYNQMSNGTGVVIEMDGFDDIDDEELMALDVTSN